MKKIILLLILFTSFAFPQKNKSIYKLISYYGGGPDTIYSANYLKNGSFDANITSWDNGVNTDKTWYNTDTDGVGRVNLLKAVATATSGAYIRQFDEQTPIVAGLYRIRYKCYIPSANGTDAVSLRV
ncbi:MAG: hypothetical protein IPL84_03845 [Chitinophagaceae bacterium]|nr:hypothetical protein [Chitinophagaceae bacterium]